MDLRATDNALPEMRGIDYCSSGFMAFGVCGHCLIQAARGRAHIYSALWVRGGHPHRIPRLSISLGIGSGCFRLFSIGAACHAASWGVGKEGVRMISDAAFNNLPVHLPKSRCAYCSHILLEEMASRRDRGRPHI